MRLLTKIENEGKVADAYWRLPTALRPERTEIPPSILAEDATDNVPSIADRTSALLPLRQWPPPTTSGHSRMLTMNISFRRVDRADFDPFRSVASRQPQQQKYEAEQSPTPCLCSVGNSHKIRVAIFLF